MAEVTVEGTVSRLNQTGNGFRVVETREYNGKTFTTYWSVFPPRNVDRFVVEGDAVKVTGGLGAKVSERDARYVDYTINNAQVGYANEADDMAWEPPASEGNWGDDTPF